MARSEYDCPPVLFLVFNRPDLTQRAFECIRNAQPAQLFVGADGPRPDHPDDVSLCAETRRIVERIDWPCEVHTLFRDENLGCKRAVSSGITWYFEHVDEGIILEDDCLPHPTFFRFCKELLDRYRDVPQVMHISGDNFQYGKKRGPESYYFSMFAHCWGWATWRSVWQHFDLHMTDWPRLRDENWLNTLWPDDKMSQYWTRQFDATHGNLIDTWDYQWYFSMWTSGGLSVLPQVNLVSNIGFGPNATHTRTTDHRGSASPPTQAMRFPLRHPLAVRRNIAADEYTHRYHLRGKQPPTFTSRVIRKLRTYAGG